MPTTLLRFVFAAALTLAVTPTVAAAPTTPYDPAAAGVDRICNATAPGAAARDVVDLARLPTHDGSVPNWQRSDATSDARTKDAPGFPGGDFATAIFDRGSVVFADSVHVDPSATGTQTRVWCFIGGKLSRATIEVFDAVMDVGWRRTLYYGDDLDKPLAEYIGQISTRKPTDPRRKAPLDQLSIDAFATPAKLPFFDAAVAAHRPATKRS